MNTRELTAKQGKYEIYIRKHLVISETESEERNGDGTDSSVRISTMMYLYFYSTV
jgi:hypothetical protein